MECFTTLWDFFPRVLLEKATKKIFKKWRHVQKKKKKNKCYVCYILNGPIRFLLYLWSQLVTEQFFLLRPFYTGCKMQNIHKNAKSLDWNFSHLLWHKFVTETWETEFRKSCTKLTHFCWQAYCHFLFLSHCLLLRLPLKGSWLVRSYSDWMKRYLDKRFSRWICEIWGLKSQRSSCLARQGDAFEMQRCNDSPLYDRSYLRLPFCSPGERLTSLY